MYEQAIFFSDNGTFDPEKPYNIGFSTATVYLANGTTMTFEAMTFPSDINLFATVPEGSYEAIVGKHKDYTALKMRDIGAKYQRIYLGRPNPNPAYKDGRTYAEGINIHKAGRDNYTGLVNNDKNGVSEGCLLIDRNDWDRFIGIFDTPEQKGNKVSVTVSRTLADPEYYRIVSPIPLDDIQNLHIINTFKY